MKKWHEFAITVAIVLVLLLLSFGLLKLPQVYFAHSDEQLNGVISIGGYDINNGIKSMTMAQKIEAFDREDILMVEEAPVIPDEELYEKLVETSLKEYLSMILYDESVYFLSDIIYFIWGKEYRSAAYNVIQVDENEIYSMKLGALEMTCTDYESVYASLLIIFDLETYDIFSFYLSYNDGDMPEPFMYKAIAFSNDAETVLNKYYETDIPWEDSVCEVSEYDIRIMPWSYAVYEKKLLPTIMRTLQENEMSIQESYP